MVRTSLPAAVAAALSLIPVAAVPVIQGTVIPPNAVGTWRLDSLLEQAVVDGMTPSDVDPATFVLADVRFDRDAAGVTAVDDRMGLGEGTVAAADGVLKLTAKGKIAFFQIPTPEVKGEQLGMIALRVRSHGVREAALFRDNPLAAFGGGPGSGPPGPNFGLGGLGRVVIPPNLPAAAANGPAPAAGAPQVPPAAPPGAGAPAGAPAGNVVPPAPAGNVVPPPPPAGGAGRRRGGVVNIPGMGNLDPRDLFRPTLIMLAEGNDWQPLARTRRELAGGSTMGMFGAGGDGGGRPFNAVTLAVLVPPGQEDEGVTLDVEYVHVLDAKADYARAPAGPTSIERAAMIQTGMYMNTPAAASYRLVAPAKAKLIAGLASLESKPWTLYVHVTSQGQRKTVLQRSFLDDYVYQQSLTPKERGDLAAAAPIVPLEVDLSAYAGQEITLTLEAVEEEEPTVAFLLQPIVTGQRKEGVRNALIYFCDTLRADALSSYGNPRPTTPNLDAVAQEGVRFERCFSQGNWTRVSMPSSLSSLAPSVNGIRSGGERLSENVTTIAEAFREAGYLTAAFIRNDFVGAQTHTEQGFDCFHTSAAIGTAAAPQRRGLENVVNQMLGRNGNANDAAILGGGGFEAGSSRDIYEKLEPWLSKYADIPTFVLLHAVDPHDPYDTFDYLDKFLTTDEKKVFDEQEKKVTDARNRAYGGNVGPAAVNFMVAGQAAAAAAPANGPAVAGANGAAATNGTADGAKPAAPPARPANERERIAQAGVDPDDYIRRQKAIYDAELHFFDVHLKRLFDLLAAKGLDDRTVFSFNADHGEEFLDHDNTGHGQSVYAELQNVPWILRAPGLVPPGQVVPDNVANLDLGPTVLGLCGIEPPADMMGRNLADVLSKGEEVPPMTIVTEMWGGGFMGMPGGDDGEVTGTFAVMQGRWKTIVRLYPKPNANAAAAAAAMGPDNRQSALPELEIYDLTTDMKDRKSLIAEHRAEAELAKKQLLAWLEENKKLHAKFAATTTIDPNAAANLRALGYLK